MSRTQKEKQNGVQQREVKPKCSKSFTCSLFCILLPPTLAREVRLVYFVSLSLAPTLAANAKTVSASMFNRDWIF